mgnify:FL=1
MGPPLTFGLGVNANETLHSIIDKSVTAENLGLKYLWVADSPVQLYAPTVAYAVASRTSRIRIGLGLMSVLLHTPDHIVDAVTTLYNTYGDRFDLCIGVGDRRQLSRVGVRVDSIESLPLRVLEAKRKIASHLHVAGIKAKIWLGAQGPKMLGIAKAFDGVLLNYSKPEMIRWAIGETGLRRTRRLVIGTYSPSYVYLKPRPSILRLAKVSSAVVALGATNAVLGKFGLYEKLRKVRQMAEQSSTIEDILSEVPDQVVRDFSITMKATNLPLYLEELRRLGVNHVVFAYPQNHSAETVKELGKALDLAT